MGKWGKYEKKYCSSWEALPDFKGWLSKSKSSEDCAFCTICKCEIRSHKADLKKHKETKKHKLNACKICPKQSNITNFGKQNISNVKKISELKIAMYIAVHSSIRSVDHLSDVINAIISSASTSSSTTVSNYLQLHRTKCTALIKRVISPVLLNELLEDIGNNPFSLIVDESTDVSIVKYMCICIKYFSENKTKIQTNIIGLIKVINTTAEQLFEELVKFIKSLNLNPKNIIGLGTDGANNLCGVRNSLYTRLKDLSPNIVLVKCVCHSLHLCASKASFIFTEKVDFLVKETYNWFKNSNLRREKYRDLFEAINGGYDNPVFSNLVQLSQTRWLSRYLAIEKMYVQYLELEAHFGICCETEKCHTARLLYEAFKDKRNKLIITFLRPILKQIYHLNLYFQRDKVDFFQAHIELKTFVQSIAQKLIKMEYLNAVGQFSESRIKVLMENPFVFLDLNDIDFGSEFEIELCRHIDKNILNVHALKTSCKEFLTVLLHELLSRLPTHLEIFSKTSFLSPEICLNHLRPNFKDLPLQFCVDKTEAEQQYQMLLSMDWAQVFSGNIPTDQVEFWSKAYCLKNAAGEPLLPDLCKFAFTLLIFLHSNAVVERAFSLMNLIKTKLRNRMMLEMVSALLRIKFNFIINNECCKQFIPTNDMLLKFDATIYDKTTSSSAEDVECEEMINWEEIQNFC